MTPEELLERFNISPKDKGGSMFCALVWLMIDGKDEDHPVPGMSAANAIAEICRRVRMPRPAVFSVMKKTLAPIFKADAITLKALRLRPQQTTVGLADEIIRSIKGGE